MQLEPSPSSPHRRYHLAAAAVLGAAACRLSSAASVLALRASPLLYSIIPSPPVHASGVVATSAYPATSEGRGGRRPKPLSSHPGTAAAGRSIAPEPGSGGSARPHPRGDIEGGQRDERRWGGGRRRKSSSPTSTAGG
uniref:Uncharacterized protein n=1 Tax=Leersia perrieri TaxID=77586 RepID=A0A0D9WAB2_9ORYZ